MDGLGRARIGQRDGRLDPAPRQIPRMLIHADCTPRYSRDETVTAPGDRLDAARLWLPVVEDATKRGDLDGQVVVLDHRSRPDGSHDLLLRDEITVALDKHTEHVVGS